MASLQFSLVSSSTYPKFSQPNFKLLGCQKPLSVRCSIVNSSNEGDGFDAKAFRHKFTRSENYKRFDNKEARKTMNEEFKSKYYLNRFKFLLIWLSSINFI
ncbi:4-hydroxy-3-methylbut-2-enyl diphosphate reductase [Artemisia annua]|uniref:4-hydroxy-3-methylbut-2-enyl diphosphate reductase n=1 Tax=Artemisia annua TaxID=35608 RepID=A0A2U1NJR8_ARTAN|nr:4-hydroxy-3-methylbut-2-enyl diphosphate reductase [Artemisia annua]